MRYRFSTQDNRLENMADTQSMRHGVLTETEAVYSFVGSLLKTVRKVVAENWNVEADSKGRQKSKV